MAWVALALELLPKLIALGMDVIPLINQIRQVLFGGKVPSEADWIALHATEDMLRRRLNQDPVAPLAAAAVPIKNGRRGRK